MYTFARDHSGQFTSVWELAPMELPIGSLKILVRYLTNPTFRIKRADKAGEPLDEENLDPQPRLHMPGPQTPPSPPMTRRDRWTPPSPTLSVSRDSSRDSVRFSVISFLLGPPLRLLSWLQTSLVDPPRPVYGEYTKTRASFLVLLFTLVFLFGVDPYTMHC